MVTVRGNAVQRGERHGTVESETVELIAAAKGVNACCPGQPRM